MRILPAETYNKARAEYFSSGFVSLMLSSGVRIRKSEMRYWAPSNVSARRGHLRILMQRI